MTPTIALWVARIRPPYFGSITGRDLFRRSAGLPVDAVSPGSEDECRGRGQRIRPTPPPRGAADRRSAAVRPTAWFRNRRGRRAGDRPARRGVGDADAGPPGAWSGRGAGRTVRGDLHQPRAGRSPTNVPGRRAGMRGRGRGVRRRGQIRCARAEDVRGGCFGALWGRWRWPRSAGRRPAGGLLVPITRFTPLVRMTAEWVEIAAIIAVLPLAAWIGGCSPGCACDDPDGAHARRCPAGRRGADSLLSR